MKTKSHRKFLQLILLSMLVALKLNSQTPPAWYTPSWQWTVSAASNWIAKTSSGPYSNIYSPFQGNPSATELQNIILAEDYLPEQGWVLLFKDFGYVDALNPLNSIDVDADMPLFLLYNKYTATIRGFFHVPAVQNTPHNSALAKLYWAAPTNTTLNNSLLAMSKDYPQANLSYPKTNNTDAFFNYLQDYPTAAGWFTTEFACNFDPNTDRNIYGQQLILKFLLSNTTHVNLSGGFTFTTQSASALETPQTGVPNSNSPSTLEDYVVQAKKFLGKVPTKTDVQDAFTTIENGVNTLDGKFCSNFTRDLHNMNSSLQNGKLKSFLIGAAGFIPEVSNGLNTLSTVLDLFSNKSNTIAASTDAISVQPTLSEGQITLTGSLTTESSGKTLFFQLPGTKHKNGGNQRIYTGLPYYDCPLGVVSLQQTPSLKKRVYTVTSTLTQTVTNQLTIASTNSTIGNPQTQVTFSQVVTSGTNGSLTLSRSNVCFNSPTTAIVSYKLDEVLELDHNLASSLTITSAKVALMFEILPFSGLTGTLATLNGSPSIDPAADHKPDINLVLAQCSSIDLFPEFTAMNSQFQIPFQISNTVINISDNYLNYVRRDLNAGVLKLSTYDNVNKLHKFQTQFVDFDKARGLSATFQDGTVKVYVKVLVVLKPNNPDDNQTPITKLLTYEVTNFTSDNTSANPYTPICEQLLEIEDDAYLNATVCNGTNTTTATGNKTGVMITNLCDLTVNPGLNTPNSTADWQADNLIKFQAPFKTTVAGTDLFKARINSTGLCQAGTNALQVNTHFANCDSDPENYRPAAPTDDIIGKDDNILAADKNSIQLKMTVAPNPNDGSFRLIFNKEHLSGNITIIDNLNRKVWASIVGEIETVDISLGDIDPGVYFILFTDRQGLNLSQKLILN